LDFSKFQTFAPDEHVIFFQNPSRKNFFFINTNRPKPGGDQIREMVATGFGSFYMESPHVFLYALTPAHRPNNLDYVVYCLAAPTTFLQTPTLFTFQG
jgi:hypothetical protein